MTKENNFSRCEGFGTKTLSEAGYIRVSIFFCIYISSLFFYNRVIVAFILLVVEICSYAYIIPRITFNN
jgi:hypothetical protein